jgi:hypothetical protein
MTPDAEASTPRKGRSETHMPRRRDDLTVTDKVMTT